MSHSLELALKTLPSLLRPWYIQSIHTSLQVYILSCTTYRMFTDIFMVIFYIIFSSSERVVIIQSVFDPVFLNIPSFHKWQLSSYREAL